MQIVKAAGIKDVKKMDVPLGDRIYPDATCEKCDSHLEVIYEAGDEKDTVFIGCPNLGEDDGHTEHNGQPRETLNEWGWEL